MQKIRSRSKEAHRKTVSSDINEIARYLEDAFGQVLVAKMVGANRKTVARWVNKESVPRNEHAETLRGVYQVVQLLQGEEDIYTIRAWFVGMNPQLNDTSPARAIAGGQLREVYVAAKSFIAGG